MDEWEGLVKDYNKDSEPKKVENLLHIAQGLIAGELASFEVEYLLSTLLQSPIHLIQIIKDKRTNEEWDACISTSLKLLGEVVSKYNNADMYYSDIVSLCLLPYTAKIRQQALSCLTNVACKSVVGAKDFHRHINALEETSTCTAPRVLLLAAICEHHPDEVMEDLNRIWRIFLNMLDCNKKTLSVKKAVLQGIHALFKHYGLELTTVELNEFYDKLVVYTKTPKFEDVCLLMFEHYSNLFPERISTDATIRSYLWKLNNNRAAVLSVYKAVADTLNGTKLLIIVNELQKYINSAKYYDKFTALHALMYVHTKCSGDLNDYIDIQTVDFEIRNGNINYEICESIFWCVKAKVLYGDHLLQTSLLFYDSFPATKRQELLQCFVNADESIRKPAAIFLTNYPQSLVWRDLLKLEDSTQSCVIRDVQNYIVGVLEREESLMSAEILPENIKSLAIVLSFLPSQAVFRVLPIYGRCFIEFVPSAILHGNHVDATEFQNISIQNCTDDEEMLRCSISYVQTDDYIVSEMVIALETILSRKNVGALNVIKALKKLDMLLQNKQLSDREVSEMLHKIEILSKCIDKSKKDDRVLQREIILFLARHGRSVTDSYKNNALIKDLEDILIWEVDNELKLKLGSVIISALEYEDVEALQILYHTICNKLATKPNTILRKALTLVIAILSRYDVKFNVSRDVNDDVARDVTYDVTAQWWGDVDGVVELVQFIMLEKSPSSRKVLINILEEIFRIQENYLFEKFLENLLSDGYSDSTNRVVSELTEISIKILESNNLLSKKFLPEILLRVLQMKKYNTQAFNMAANVFIDKIELFDDNTVEETIDNIFNIINPMGVHERLNIKMSMKLIKRIFDLNKNNKDILEHYSNIDRINLIILIEMKHNFDFDCAKCEVMLQRNNFLNIFFNVDSDYVKDGAVFEFVKTFSNNLKNYKIGKLIAKALKELSLEKITYKDASVCLSLFKCDDISKTIQDIIQGYPIKEITESIEKYSFEKQHEAYVNALKTILKAEPILMEPFKSLVKRWLERIIVLHEVGFIEMNLCNKMEYLMDLVEVSLNVVSREELKVLLLKDIDNNGPKFFQVFMKASYRYLMDKPYIMATPEMERTNVLLIDILKHAAIRNEKEKALEIGEALWSIFNKISTHKQKLEFFKYLPSLPPNVKQWVVDTMNQREVNLDKKLEIVMATSDKEISIHAILLPHLPSRVSELRGTTATCFRVLLDGLCQQNSHCLDQIAQIAATDPTKGWWDDALEMCVSVMVRAGQGVLPLARACDRARGCSTGRILLPMLRYSKSSDCEEFFSATSEDLLSVLKKCPRATDHHLYGECVSEYVRAFDVAQVVFGKLSKDSIEKNSRTSESFVKTVCKLCVTLRDKVDANYSEFHCANYNCLVSAICMMDPGPAIYRTVFDAKVWRKLIDQDELLDLPIREQWNQRTARHAAPHCALAPASLRLASARTRMFTRTLSENPFQFDLTQELEQHTVEPQEIIVKDSVLNRHSCIAAFKMLFNKKNAIDDILCRKALEDTIGNNETHVNVRCLLAEAVCNSKEELKVYANSLQSALLALVVDTSKDGVLNDLHINVLDSLIYWHQDTEEESSNIVISNIIKTAIFYGSRKNIFYSLVERLVKLLGIWRNVVISWSCFEEHVQEHNQETLKLSLHILKNVLKCNKYIPKLLPAFIDAMRTRQVFIEVCVVFGMALALERNKGHVMEQFNAILKGLYRSDVMEYIKVLYYTQKAYPLACDGSNFRKITDLMQKITSGREKSKCLTILNTYIQNVSGDDVTHLIDATTLLRHLDTVEGLQLVKTILKSMSELERENLSTEILKIKFKNSLYEHAADVLTEILKLKLSSTHEPPAKKIARESNSLLLFHSNVPILTLLSHWGQVYGLSELLNDDLKIRFYECFQIILVLSKSKSETIVLRLVDLFLRRFKSMEGENRASTSTSLTKEKSRDEVTTAVSKSPATKEEISDMILKYSQQNTNAALSFTIQLLRLYPKGPKFDFINDGIVQLMSEPKPWIMGIARAADVWRCDGVPQIINGLLKKTKGTDVEDICKLLYEECKLRCEGPEQFVLGLFSKCDEEMPEVSTKFTLNDLICSFGKLSNWSDLTLQHKKSVKSELPCLWTVAESFREDMTNSEFQGPMWLNAMIKTYTNDETVVIPYDTYKSPRNYFELSVISEISMWNEIKDNLQIQNGVLDGIHPKDCMAQWAARIAMRSLYLRSVQDNVGDKAGVLSRSHEVAWCERASEMELHAEVLQCCKRTTDLYESEMLKWLSLKLSAVRGIAMESRDTHKLKSALDLADEHASKFIDMSSVEDIIKIDLVTLQLRNDLKCISENNVVDILEKVKGTQYGGNISENNKINLESICVLCITFLEQCEGVSTQKRIFNSMLEALSIYVQLDLGPKSSLLADVIINKIDSYDFGSISHVDSIKFLNTLKLLDLNYISKDFLKSRLTKFSSTSELLNYFKEERTERVKKCLSLIGDPEHLLQSYCLKLINANDCESFNKTLNEMKMSIFENDFAQQSTDYKILNRYKENLYIITYGDTQKTKETLTTIISQLEKSKKGDYIYLSQLCPILANEKEIENESETISQLFKLKRGVKIVKFEEKIQVKRSTLYHPVVVKCRLSDGRSRRYMVKRGERVQIHCASVYMNEVFGLRRGYQITPLSDVCCLIEYLEDHESIRKIITDKYDIDIPEIAKRTNDKELILDLNKSVQEFQMLCEKLPSYLLRNSIEESCTSVQDFICKKMNFLNTVCDMTVFSYLCGLSDRHLENMMYSKQDGGACHVDCAAILEDGGELSPARLTRNIVAVCDNTVLEARIQKKLLEVRGNQNIILPSLTLVFKWMGEKYLGKFNLIKDLIQGKELCFNQTIENLSASKLLHKEKYVEMLRDVFSDFESKTEYTVEEQVSSLLRQSTDQRILSVTRSNWEPWI